MPISREGLHTARAKGMVSAAMLDRVVEDTGGEGGSVGRSMAVSTDLSVNLSHSQLTSVLQ